MKSFKTNSQNTIRNNFLEKINKRENSILSNRSNISSSRINDDSTMKSKTIKLNLDKKYEVILIKFRNMKKIGNNYNLGLLIEVIIKNYI